MLEILPDVILRRTDRFGSLNQPNRINVRLHVYKMVLRFHVYKMVFSPRIDEHQSRW